MFWHSAKMVFDAVMLIREALLTEAARICEVLRRSISELCAADHGDDPEILARWLSNKTPDNIRAWILRPDNSMLVAVEGTSIIAAGSVTDAGEVTLNYVSPDARCRGISRAMMQALEECAAARGNTRCMLTSTETAHCFYQALGYMDDGPPSISMAVAAAISCTSRLRGRGRGRDLTLDVHAKVRIR